MAGAAQGHLSSGSHAPCTQWPYCEKRCTYCNFNKYIPRGVDEAALRRCLVTEAQTLLRLSGVRRWVLGPGSWELHRAAEQVAGILEGSRTFSSAFSFPRVESVFFGGGTPSLASPHTVAAVLEVVAQAAHLPADSEVTLEANPTSASGSRLAAFGAAGVNRLSIGLQVTHLTHLILGHPAHPVTFIHRANIYGAPSVWEGPVGTEKCEVTPTCLFLC